jgi:hypothetical protein
VIEQVRTGGIALNSPKAKKVALFKLVIEKILITNVVPRS